MIYQKKGAVLLAALLTLFCLTACSNGQAQSEPDIEMENLPYGATMETDSTLPVPIEFDKRYFEDAAEITALSNYFYALQTKDEDLYRETTLDDYMDFVTNQMYQGLAGLDGLLTQQNDLFAQQAGNAEFTFVSVSIQEYEQDTDTDNSNLENLYGMLDELSEEENYSQTHITTGKFLKLDITLLADGTTTLLSDQYVFLICVDGTYQVCP